MKKPKVFDAIIIGAGFYGCEIALYLRRFLKKIIILEKESDLLLRASYNNQARVHNGYHYPRSFLTALRSRINFPKFTERYADCLDTSFTKYYAIGRHLSNVSASSYKRFCQRVGLELKSAPRQIRSLFNPSLIEEVFQVTEYAFDALELRKRLAAEIKKKGIDCLLGKEVEAVRIQDNGLLKVLCRREGKSPATQGLLAKRVFNCTYSQINKINAQSQLPIIPFKHELTEMVLIKTPDQLQNLGITVMCGPFFSLMPFPSRKCHCLTHVRYTPHYSWHEHQKSGSYDPHSLLKSFPRQSAAAAMIRDASRYLPTLSQCHYSDSLWEIKTVLPESELDDSRPILFRQNHGLPNYTCILGGKIDNIFDVFSELDTLYGKTKKTL